jgi:hypothetical protein
MAFKLIETDIEPLEVITCKEAIEIMEKEHERIVKWNEETRQGLHEYELSGNYNCVPKSCNDDTKGVLFYRCNSMTFISIKEEQTK